MIQSIKVDIVYYSIGSDFEMEFNLCGCCRMRLLTDKVRTQAEFSKSLARAVKRSKVIVLCGPLFGDKGLIKTVAKVTGIETEKLDNAAYELDENTDIDILRGATALVSEDGVFGGCIIESNTQSIIILSESKSLRKNIMKQLIYPYITKLSIMTDDNVDLISGDENDNTISPEVIADEISVKDNPDEEKPENEKPEEVKHIEQIDEDNDSESPADSDDENATDEDVAPQDNDDENRSKSDDFVIDISNSNVDQAATDPNEQPDLFDNALIFDLPQNEKNMSVEEKNQKYYLFEDEGEEFNDDTKINVAIKIVVVFIVLIALIMAYFAVVKPIIMQKDILTYIRGIFSSKLLFNVFKLF